MTVIKETDKPTCAKKVGNYSDGMKGMAILCHTYNRFKET